LRRVWLYRAIDCICLINISQSLFVNRITQKNAKKSKREGKASMGRLMKAKRFMSGLLSLVVFLGILWGVNEDAALAWLGGDC